MSKLTILCTAFKPLCRNSLRGFATIRIAEMKMSLLDVPVHMHERSGRAWATPPGKPIYVDGRPKLDDRGKQAYAQLVDFDSKAIRDAFSEAVVAAVLRFDARALDCRESAA